MERRIKKEAEAVKKWMKKVTAPIFLICLCAGILTGCGNGIKKETAEAVNGKMNQALQTYSDIEKLVQENNLKVEKEFTDMKGQLTELSTQVKSEINDTTEEDGQRSLKELDGIIKNLQEVKENLEKMIAESK